MARSTISLLFTGLLCLIVIYFATKVVMGSLYQIGLTNVFEQYDAVYADETLTAENREERQTRLLEDIKFLNSKMLSWDRSSPGALSLASYTELLNSYANENVDSFEYFINKGIELNERSIALRPIYPDIYAQQVYALNALAKPKEVVFQELYLAERFGPYEKATATAGLDFYFGFWEQISNQDKIKASSYVLSPHKYGLSRDERDAIIANAPYKERVCNLLAFSGERSRACRK